MKLEDFNRRSEVEGLEDKPYNFDEGQLTKGFRFYWVPLLLLFAPFMFFIFYSLPLFSESPKIYLGSEDALAATFSGYALCKLNSASTIWLGFTIASLCLLGVSSFLLAFFPYCRGVRLSNVVFGLPWLFFTFSNTGTLLSVVSEVSRLDASYRAAQEMESEMGSISFFNFTNLTFWALLVLPILFLLWWIAVNLINLSRLKKEKASGEAKTDLANESDGEKKEEEPAPELILVNEDGSEDDKENK